MVSQPAAQAMAWRPGRTVSSETHAGWCAQSCDASSRRASVVLAVVARLGHGEGASAPNRRQPARRERAGDRRFAGTLAGVSAAGACGNLLARDRVRIAGAMAVAPPHQIDVD